MQNLSGRYEHANEGGAGLRYGIIEVTTKCQLNCPGCYMPRKKGQAAMTFSDAVKVLDLCRYFCGRELETMDILGGEPLLWPHLREYIEVLLDRGILPWVFTNMLAITPELAKWLFERGVHVTGKLNIDPSDPNQLKLQAEMVGTTVTVARKMISAIDVFLQAGYRDPLFRLENLVRRSNLSAIPNYYRWCIDHNIGTDPELLASGGRIGPEYRRLAPRPEELAEMIRQLEAIRMERGLPPAQVLVPHVFGACVFKKKGLYFAADGKIRACSSSKVTLAHLGEADPIGTAWSSSVLWHRRELNQQKVGEPCRSCDRWEQCQGGCRATAEGTGNPNAGYPICPVPYL